MPKILTLGEAMIRLSTKVGERTKSATVFESHYGGSEANVAISLANFGDEAALMTKVPDNSLGYGLFEHLQKFNVSIQHVLLGGKRLGLYFLESGVGPRASKVVYDRADSSFATMVKNEWTDQNLFDGVDIFHVSGITTALSKDWLNLTVELIKQAKANNCKISFDVNYRGNLWTQAEAGNALKEILPFVDYCSIGKLDAKYLLKINAPISDVNEMDYYYQEIQKLYPQLQVMYSTCRTVHSASENELQGMFWTNNHLTRSRVYKISDIVDRVGGGDAFSAGILHEILCNKTEQEIVDFATAASVLKHTVSGDANQFNELEVEEFMCSEDGKIIR